MSIICELGSVDDKLAPKQDAIILNNLLFGAAVIVKKKKKKDCSLC